MTAEKMMEIAQIQQKFSDDYFQDEVREGFFVEKKMKCAWAAQIEVLMEIDRICKKHGIQYFADSGTLLGAIRHKGYIPWDDDVDIAMKREDYQKFFAVVQDELPDGWIAFNAASDKTASWDQSFGRVVNADNYNTGSERLFRFHGCPYVVGVDIFPLDWVPADKEEEAVLNLIMKYLWGAISLYHAEKRNECEEILQKLEELCRVKIDREKNLLNQMLRLADSLCCLYKEGESQELGLLMWKLNEDKEYKYKKEWYDESILMPFENIMIPVPVGYEGILRVLYGDDYMTPKRGTADHDYPFYKKQDEAVMQAKREKEMAEETSNAGRIYGEKVDIDTENTEKLYNARAKRIHEMACPYTAVLLGDQNPEYAEDWNRIEKELVLPKLKVTEKSYVADFGCGIGRWAESIIPICRKYTGIDFSSGMIGIAEERCAGFQGKNYQFVCNSFQQFIDSYDEKNGKIDVVIMSYVCMYINDSDLRKYFEKLLALLADNCTIYFLDTVGLEERLTLKEIYSQALKSEYDALYRTVDEYAKLHEIFCQNGFDEIVSGFMPKLNSEEAYKETDRYYSILQRRS